MTSINVQNAHKHCRTCLVNLDSCLEIDKIHNIPAYVKVKKFENILELMRILVDSNADDIERYPQNICLICFRVLEEIYEFRKNVLKCTNTLKSILGAKELLDDETITQVRPQEEQALEKNNDNVLIETQTILTVDISPTLKIIPTDVDLSQNTTKESYSNDDYEKAVSARTILENSYHNDTVADHTNKKQNDETLHISKERKDNKSKTFKCDQCKISFVQLSKYLTHVRQVHSVCKRRYGCDNCDKSYKRIDTLRNHLYVAHDSKVQPIECIDCGKLYKTKATLKQHRLNQHLSEDKIKKNKDYACEQCDASFVRPKSLASHYIAKHNADTSNTPLEFKCSKCNIHFRTQFNLENHTLRYHSNERNFVCSICGTRYARKFMLVTHMRIHCTDAEKFLCDQCGRRFAQKCDVAEHIRAVHFKTKPFKCQQCDQLFATAKTLRHHMYRHTGEKPYACDICDKTFRQLTAMKLHRSRHSLSTDDK